VLGNSASRTSLFDKDVVVYLPQVVVEMVKTRLAQEDVKQRGWLLDGYPRSASQAEAIEKEGIRPDVFLLIEVMTGRPQKHIGHGRRRADVCHPPLVL
jgi:adenylate kinase family enzyme